MVKKIKLKYLANFSTGNSISNKEDYLIKENSYSYIATKDIDLQTNKINYENGIYIKKDNLAFKATPKDSILLCIEGASAGKKIAFTNRDICFVNKLCSIKSFDSKVSDKFLFYNMQGSDFKNQFFSSINGLIGGVSFNTIKDFKLPIPPLEEQNKIVAYIDKKSIQLENFIAKKTRFIALLKEQKEAVINEAVTKGIDKTVEFKESGIEWLGKLPKHWEVYKLKYAVEKIGDIDHYMPDSVSCGKPYIMTGDMFEKASLINFSNCKQVSEEDFLRLSQKIKPTIGDLIFARYATIGTVCYVDIEKDFLVSYACVTIKPNHQKIIGKYLFYFLKSNFFLEEIKNYINSNTQGNVGIDSLYRTRLIVPPIEEQKQIVKHIETKLNQIDKIIDKTTKQIDFIKEYKTSLIDEAVSGKIKVSNEL